MWRVQNSEASSDVTDEEWAFAAPYLVLMHERAPQRQYLLEHETRFRQQVIEGRLDVTHTSLALIVADDDAPATVQDALAQQQRLQQQRLQPLSAYGLRTSYHVEAGEDHMSLPFRISSRILHQAFRARRQ